MHSVLSVSVLKVTKYWNAASCTVLFPAAFPELFIILEDVLYMFEIYFFYHFIFIASCVLQ